MGIWFYEEDEADKVETLLHRILAAYPTTSTAPSGHEQVCIPPRCMLKRLDTFLWTILEEACPLAASACIFPDACHCKLQISGSLVHGSARLGQQRWSCIQGCNVIGKALRFVRQAAQSRGEGNNAGDDAFWDQRAPSPPADFDPFAGRVAGGAAAAAASPAPPLVTPGPAPAMMTPGPPAPPSGTPIGATPPKSPGSFLRGARLNSVSRKFPLDHVFRHA